MDQEETDGLKLSRVTKSYGAFTLGPIDLFFATGTAYGLLGPNGAGKTTLLGSMAAQLHHDGKVSWGQTPITALNPRLREWIAYISETPNFYDELSVDQTLRFCGDVFRQWDGEAAREWRMRLNLDSRKKVGALSKGMRTKLGILIGISHQARVLLLDEPTAGLDPESREDIQQHLKALCIEKQACLIISSHLFEDLESVADEILILRDGKIRFHAAMDSIGELKTYEVNASEMAILQSSAGILTSKASRGSIKVVVVDPSRVSAEVTEVLGALPQQQASLRDVYFAYSRSEERFG